MRMQRARSSENVLLAVAGLFRKTGFIEFQTNEFVSDDKETINRSIQNRVRLLLFPRLFEDLRNVQL